MQRKFFYESTESLTYALASEPSYCLSAPKLVEVFNQICQENNFIEYYLLDMSFNFLLL